MLNPETLATLPDGLYLAKDAHTSDPRNHLAVLLTYEDERGLAFGLWDAPELAGGFVPLTEADQVFSALTPVALATGYYDQHGRMVVAGVVGADFFVRPADGQEADQQQLEPVKDPEGAPNFEAPGPGTPSSEASEGQA